MISCINEGISLSGDLLDTGVFYKMISKNGNIYTYNQTKLGVGREVAKKFLRENPKLMQEIKRKIWQEAQKEEV